MEPSPSLQPADVAVLLEAQATVIRAEVSALPAELGRWQPGDGEWSAGQVLGHLIEAERRGFAGRIRTLLESDRPPLPGWDQEVVAEARNDRARELPELLAEFEALRAESVLLVRSLTAEQLDRWGTHVQVGEMSVRDLLHEWVHHDRNHVKQLLSIAQTAVWPHMGNCRRFSEFD